MWFFSLFVLSGHEKVVEQLLKAGASIDEKMGDLSALTIATEFEHDGIVEMIKSHSKSTWINKIWC